MSVGQHSSSTSASVASPSAPAGSARTAAASPPRRPGSACPSRRTRRSACPGPSRSCRPRSPGAPSRGALGGLSGGQRVLDRLRAAATGSSTDVTVAVVADVLSKSAPSPLTRVRPRAPAPCRPSVIDTGRRVLAGAPRRRLRRPCRTPARRPWRAGRVRQRGRRPLLAVDLQALHVDVLRAVLRRLDDQVPAVLQVDGRLGEQRRADGVLAAAHHQRVEAERGEEVPGRLLAVVLVAVVALADLAAGVEAGRAPRGPSPASSRAAPAASYM